MTEKKKNGSGGKTRREFLRDAGLLVGGTAIGSTVLLAACGGGETTETVTDKFTTTVTESMFICPIDSIEFDTLAELKAHFEVEHPEEPTIEGLITLKVNGNSYLAQVKPEWSLAFVLREKLGM
ncbi:unnamed protein product, partial [marine sediment metagenome]